MKKILATFLAGALLFGMCACNEAGIETKNVINVWTCSANTKVLRAVEYDTSNKTFEIGVFKNESESAQIIITPEKDVAEYTIALNDLTATDGSMLGKENFSVYNQKYILVEQIKDMNINAVSGYYPDALLPFEKAVEYDENKIVGGENQGIYVTLKAPEDQPAGVYTGNFVIVVDGEQYNIPVEVTVYDFVLPTKTHVKSSYAVIENEMAYGELDTSVEMIEEYYEFLLDYRISGQNLPYGGFKGYLTEDVLDTWTAYALKYAQDERCSHYNMVYEITNVSNGTYIDADGNSITYSGSTVNGEKIEMLYDKLMRKSMETGVNLFEKLGSYFAVFDEAEANGLMEYANYSLYHVNQAQARAIEKYKNDSSFGVKEGDIGDEAFRQELIDSLCRVKHKFVGPYTEALETEACYVPKIHNYDSQSGRNLYNAIDAGFYGENGELWSYHCMDPLAPYPTVHLEDEVLGTRVMGWIMHDYNIVGSLYWDVTLYAYRENHWDNLQLTDYYSTALRFPAANGDGFLLYPGAPYGIYGPVASIRLAALRDAFEDYDLLYAFKEMYKQNGLSEEIFNNAVEILNTRLYNGAKVKHGVAQVSVFDEVRATLAEMLVLANKGVFVTDVSEQKGKTVFAIQTPNGVEVKSGGTVLSGVSDGENTVYTVEIVRETSRNELQLTFGAESQTLPLSIYVGGKQKAVSADSYTLTVKNKNNEYSTESVTIENMSGTRVSSDVVTDGNRNGEYVNIRLSNLEINEKTQKLIFYVYNNGETTQTFDVYFQSEGNVQVVKFESYELAQGMNVISMDISILVKQSTLTNMRLLFSETSAIDLTFADIVISE